MLEVFDWLRGNPHGNRDWLILGKGPSFSRHRLYPDLDAKYATLGMNDACRERETFATHILDYQAVGRVGLSLPDRTRWLIMAWHPHVKFSPSKDTLERFASDDPVIGRFDREGRLVWYNASTSPDPRPGSPKVRAVFFSGDAVVRLLAMAGFKRIRTLGMDGGSKYAEEFKDLKPLLNGHSTFDPQNGPIWQTVKEFGLDFGPMEP